MKRIFLLVTSLCVLHISAETTIVVKKEGTLSGNLSYEQQDTITSLVIEGPINSADIRLLRRMAGYREHESDKAGRLRTLDLRNARITSDKEPYLVLDATEEGLTVEGFHRVQSDREYAYKERGKNTAYYRGAKYDPYSHRANDFFRPRYILRNYGHKQKSSVSTSPNGDVVIHLGKEYNADIDKTLRKKNLNKLKGLRLKLENGHHMLYCYPKKNEFVMSMFYDCPELAAVSIPSNAEVSQAVVVLRDDIRYYQFVQKESKLATRIGYVPGDYE